MSAKKVRERHDEQRQQRQMSLLIEEFKISRSEIACAATYIEYAVRTILVSLGISMGGLVVQHLKSIQNEPLFRDLTILFVGLLLLIAVLYFCWALSHYVFILARCSYELNNLRPIIIEIVDNDQSLKWDLFDHDYKRLWVHTQSIVAASLYFMLVAFHVTYLIVFGYGYTAKSFSPALNNYLFFSLGWLSTFVDLAIFIFVTYLLHLAPKHFKRS